MSVPGRSYGISRASRLQGEVLYRPVLDKSVMEEENCEGAVCSLR